MKEVISVINQKGGVGKSTTALAIGAGLTLKGYKVLLVDLDAQGNLTYNLNGKDKEKTSFEVLTGEATAKDAIIKTSSGDLIPASPALARVETQMPKVSKENRLKEVLGTIKNKYDYIILDTPPALSLLTINALTASNSVIIPATADLFSLQGLGQLSQTIKAVKEHLNQSLKIKGIVLTQHNPRTVLTRDITELFNDTAKQLNTKVYKTKIRNCIAIREAQAMLQNIFEYAPKSNASIDYTNLIEEILKEK